MNKLDEKLIAALETEERKVPLDWLTAHPGLIKTMRMRRQQMPEHARSNYDACKYNKSDELDKLFATHLDAASLKHIDVKHFIINNVLDELRPEMDNLSATTINRMLHHFCFTTEYDEIAEHRKEVYQFLMESLERRPPLYADSRWFWLCVVTSSHHTDPNDDGHVRQNVDQFGKLCIDAFLNSTRTSEYQLFLITLLEYDYAALAAREQEKLEQGQNVQKQPQKKSHSSSSSKSRLLQLNSMTDLDRIPLAYLLLCRVSQEQGMLVEKPETGASGLEGLFQKLVLYFNPKDKGHNHVNASQSAGGSPHELMRNARMYSRLIGLLLDALLYVESGTDQYHHFSMEQLHKIPTKVSNLVRKIREADFDDTEWLLFADTIGSPWIRELADRPGFRTKESIRTPQSMSYKRRIPPSPKTDHLADPR